MEASMSKTPAKKDNALIMMLVLAVVAALSMLAGYFFKPNQSGDLIMTLPTTQSPATGDAKNHTIDRQGVPRRRT